MNFTDFTDTRLKQKETELTKSIRKHLDLLGIWNWKPVQQGFGCKKGIPDIICCWNGKFIAIEVKVGRNKVSAHQEKTINEINQHGGLAFVAYSLDDVLSQLGVEDRFHPSKILKGKLGI